MRRSTQHVIPNPNGGWDVLRGGAERATKHYARKANAISRAIEISKNQKSELYIHGSDGRILSKNSYGNDPCPPKDRN